MSPRPAPATVQCGGAAIVDRWIVEHLHGSIATRDTESWNFLGSKFAVLKALLEKEHDQ